ncbi:MAG: hypothetical protein FWD59_09395 [Micrococcales bacterium]|nr:hypothetical protein [Micrococcales bacterium]
MTALLVDYKGEVTIGKDVTSQLGVGPGESLELTVLPDGAVRIAPRGASGRWGRFYGCLAGRSPIVATIEEINETIEAGWAGEVK